MFSRPTATKQWPRALICLERIEAAGNGRKVKEDLLAAESDNEVLKWMLNITYNPYVNLYISAPGKLVSRSNADADLSVLNQFVALVQQLSSRALTGNLARETIDKTLKLGSKHEEKWMQRVLNRDLRIGVNAKTINKVWPGTVPEFKCPLAWKFEDHQAKVTYPVYVETKFDGHRLFVVYDAKTDRVSAVSRGGRDKVNVSHVLDAIAKAAKNILEAGGQTFASGFVLDGELVGMTFNDSAAANRKKNTDAAKALKFIVFDVCPRKKFESGEGWTLPLRRRRKLLKAAIKGNKHLTGAVELSAAKLAANEDEVFQHYAEQRAAGLEGTMVKDRKGGYDMARTTAWLKLKSAEETTLSVVSAIEGRGKNVGKLGALVCKMPTGATSQVGGGWRYDCSVTGPACDKKRPVCRTCLWKKWPKLVGKRLDAISQLGSTISSDKLRHSRFSRWRTDLDA